MALIVWAVMLCLKPSFFHFELELNALLQQMSCSTVQQVSQQNCCLAILKSQTLFCNTHFTFHNFSQLLELHLPNSSSVTLHSLKLSCGPNSLGPVCCVESPSISFFHFQCNSLSFSPCTPGWIFCSLHFSLQTYWVPQVKF